ncbi:unnamed protein product [Cyprideis torosa]|uniref:Uncharacterized protein n=1 Tax=Cyprideis torosa TaxID=163714 RepID=A0A7R8ZKW8_9CRUS|nr:unnamed protein product [Cyprideis torosa]CAG0881125.1 unnamed protein product [Cyprideis torosa]
MTSEANPSKDKRLEVAAALDETLKVADIPKWKDLTPSQKRKRAAVTTLKVIGVFVLLYFFICSLDLLSSAFKLMAGKATGDIFASSDLLSNPVVGVIIGILSTVLVQSSSTSTSIIVSLVTAGVTDVKHAIPMIMGANMGTSVTNTLVSMAHAGDREEFRRAFAGATVHDCFNILSIVVLLPLELITGKYIFHDTSLSDSAVGIILLIISLLVMSSCLIFVVKILHSVLQGQIASVIKRIVNADIPAAPWLTGYIAILVGAFMTFLVQSSSVFTSALTPLVGVGIIEVDRVYPLTLGSNLGTTSTAILASLTATGDKLKPSLQAALCHLVFNLTEPKLFLTGPQEMNSSLRFRSAFNIIIKRHIIPMSAIIGLIIFYVVPLMRIPIPMCKFLGKTTAKYRWFAIVYILGVFFLIPALILGLSAVSEWLLLGVLIPILLLLIAVLTISTLQRKKPSILPKVLKNWKFLPEPLRSLAPLDRFFSRLPCCKKLHGLQHHHNHHEETPGEAKEGVNPASDFAMTSMESRKQQQSPPNSRKLDDNDDKFLAVV